MTPRILLSNDDGIDAAGLSALAEGLEGLGELIVVAPSENQSGASHSLTLAQPLRVRRDGPSRFRVEGTPTDCVNLGFFRLLDRLPELVVSGVNDGLNIGEDVIYSGTVAAAREGALLGRPSIAVSRQRGGQGDYGSAAGFARLLARRVLRHGLPEDTLLNVNVPAGQVRGVRLTRQGRRMTHNFVPADPGERSEEYFWVGEVSPAWKDDPQSDQAAIAEGYISVTPLHPDLTHHGALDDLASWILDGEY